MLPTSAVSTVISCGSTSGLRTSSGISQCTMWLLSWVHNYVMLCQNSMHSPALTPTVQCSESARNRPSIHYLGVTFIRKVCHSWAKTLHSVKILYRHAKPLCAICIQRTRWLAAKQTKLGTGSSVRGGRRTKDYLQCQEEMSKYISVDSGAQLASKFTIFH